MNGCHMARATKILANASSWLKVGHKDHEPPFNISTESHPTQFNPALNLPTGKRKKCGLSSPQSTLGT